MCILKSFIYRALFPNPGLGSYKLKPFSIACVSLIIKYIILLYFFVNKIEEYLKKFWSLKLKLSEFG